MKNIARKFLTILLASLMVFAMTATSFAGTQYRVRIFSGELGSAATQVITQDYNTSTVVTVSDSSAGLTDTDKYYVKGLKPAGKDNNATASELADSFASRTGDNTYTIRFVKDMDFVVAYGANENAVTYTVNFLDGNGKTLAASKTFKGDVGDKPVVAAAYIDGYVPATLNLTGTLKADSSQNVFTFYYREALPGENVEETIEIANGGGGANGANGQPGVNIEEVQTPRNIVDLDDEETPLANNQLDSGLSAATTILISAGSLAIIGLFIWALARKKKNEATE